MYADSISNNVHHIKVRNNLNGSLLTNYRPNNVNGGKMYAPSSSHIEFSLDWYKSQGANQIEMDGKDFVQCDEL